MVATKEDRKKALTLKDLYEMYEKGEEMLISLGKASRALGIHRSSLRQYITEGKLKGYRFDRNFYVKVSDLVNFIEQHELIGR